jgi:hypothetical protein
MTKPVAQRVRSWCLAVLTPAFVALGDVGSAWPRDSKATSNSDAAKNASISSQPPAGIRVLDGGTHPERIPDEIAYSLFFRSLAARHLEAAEANRRARSLLANCKGGYDFTDAEIVQVVALARELAESLAMLDGQANATRNAKPRNPEHAGKELAALQKRKADVIRRAVASLPGRLGGSLEARVRRYCQQTVKRQVRVVTIPHQATQ